MENNVWYPDRLWLWKIATWIFCLPPLLQDPPMYPKIIDQDHQDLILDFRPLFRKESISNLSVRCSGISYWSQSRVHKNWQLSQLRKLVNLEDIMVVWPYELPFLFNSPMIKKHVHPFSPATRIVHRRSEQWKGLFQLCLTTWTTTWKDVLPIIVLRIQYISRCVTTKIPAQLL